MSQAEFERPPLTAIFEIALHARREKTATTTATPRHAFFTFDKFTRQYHRPTLELSLTYGHFPFHQQ